MKKGSQLVVTVVDEKDFFNESVANEYADLELFAGNQVSKRFDMDSGKWIVRVFETNKAIEVA